MPDNSNMIIKQFAAEDGQLAAASAFLDEELEKRGAGMKETMQLQVALEEIFVNISHYAYEGSDKERIMTLGAGDVDGMFVLEFTDWGMFFDPLAKPDPDTTLEASEREIGGLGIFMVKKTMDDVSYRYEDQKNILTLKKKIGG